MKTPVMREETQNKSTENTRKKVLKGENPTYTEVHGQASGKRVETKTGASPSAFPNHLQAGVKPTTEDKKKGV